MIFLLSFILLLFFLYGILIFYYWISWTNIPVFSAEGKSASVRLSVIIPARNEEENIARLLQALKEQTHPAEIIVVDDHSTDQTTSVVSRFQNVRLVTLETDNINAYKKKAIAAGIAIATGDVIVTTDADCLPPPSWLKTMAVFFEERKAAFVAAPVVIDCNTSVVQIFQALDFMVLQGITGASVHQRFHHMCNGANLAYEKKLFYDVNGFQDIDQIASGDDMLLMGKIGKLHPERIHYLKSQDALVHTTPQQTWGDFFNQRIRWASKARFYDDRRITAVLLLVYLLNLSFFGLLGAACVDPSYWLYLGGAWLLKTIIEYPFFISLTRFFGKQWAIPYFLFFQPLHIIYMIIAGLLGQFGKYEWKGRRVQ
jgi:poly-beta-1,6-N-acetyl-D-glucosamine synthase